MEDIISVRYVSHSRYEELLLRRENIKKQEFQYQQAYIREFGALILGLFEKKMECIRKKKMIQYCQTALNHGNSINQEELQRYLNKELAVFQEQLDSMIKDYDAANDNQTISEYDLLKIKKIYRKLAKQIHPDMNPLIANSEELKDLWNQIIIAYRCNDLKTMEELEVMALKALKDITNGCIEIDIPQIDEKIASLEAEIIEIQNTDPY